MLCIRFAPLSPLSVPLAPSPPPAAAHRITAALHSAHLRPYLFSFIRRRYCRRPPPCFRQPAGPPAADFRVSGAGEELEDEIGRLLELLPPEIRGQVEGHPELGELVEVVMDLGRRPLARFPSGDVPISDRFITFDDILHATIKLGEFGADNRAGISRTLHRISAIRNRKGVIIGLTCRVGRAVPGSANLVRDLVKDGGSLLLIGPPGVGKTTIIREIARMLADEYKKRVIIVDTSNEIGGDGDIPHAGIGSARRLQVPNADVQHKVLIEAVENHMPQVIVIDEIGTKLEAMAASTIAQRGIQLVATAHGVTFENLIMNPSLEMLVGGVQSVTLGDEEASRRGAQKTILERKGPSTFTCGAEIISKLEVRVHRNLEETVDALLAGRIPNFEVRRLESNGFVTDFPSHAEQSSGSASNDGDNSVEDHSLMDSRRSLDSALYFDHTGHGIDSCNEAEKRIILYLYGVSEVTVLQAIEQLQMEDIFGLTDIISEATAFLALQAKLKKNPQLQAVTRSNCIPVFVTKTSSLIQITKALQALADDLLDQPKHNPISTVGSSERVDALEEARLAIEQVVIPEGRSVKLLPRPPSIISLQVGLIEDYQLKWEIVGREPNSCLRIIPYQTESPMNHMADNGSDGFLDSTTTFSDKDSLQNGVVGRLPLLPE